MNKPCTEGQQYASLIEDDSGNQSFDKPLVKEARLHGG
jgi:hypothetical protein